MNTTVRTIPFVRIGLPFVFGIICGIGYDQPAPHLKWPLAFGIILLLILARRQYDYKFRWVFGVYAYMVLGLAGFYHTLNHNESYDPEHFSKVAPDAMYYVGVIQEQPGKGDRIKCILRIHAAGPHPDSLLPCRGCLMVFIRDNEKTDNFRYGDMVGLEAEAKPVQKPQNPEAFDYARYLHFKNIHYQVNISGYDVVTLSSGHGSFFWKIAYRCREYLLEMLREHFPARHEYAVASALLVGYKDEISDDLREAYMNTGAMHSLVVSGTHVGVVYILLISLIGLLRFRGIRGLWIEAAWVIGGIWAFAMLTGAGASVLRAAAMFTLYRLAKPLLREAPTWNIIASSAVMLLVYNPYYLMDVGFQLSYFAVAGIVFFYPLFDAFYVPFRPLFMPAWRVLLVGVSAQLGTMPLSLYYFHQFPVYFWLSGWVVCIGGAGFLFGGAALALLHGIWHPLAVWFGKLVYNWVWAVNRLIFSISDLPGSVIGQIWIPAWAAVALYVIMAALSAGFIRRSAAWLLVGLGLTMALMSAEIYRQWRRYQDAYVAVYHAGRNQAIDLISVRKTAYIGDTLSEKQSRNVLSGYRMARGVKQEYFLGKSPADTLLAEMGLRATPPLWNHRGYRIAIVDDPVWVAPCDSIMPISVHALVMSGSPRVDMADCLARFPTQTVVIGANNARRLAENWQAACAKAGVACHDIHSQGAWVRQTHRAGKLIAQ